MVRKISDELLLLCNRISHNHYQITYNISLNSYIISYSFYYRLLNQDLLLWSNKRQLKQVKRITHQKRMHHRASLEKDISKVVVPKTRHMANLINKNHSIWTHLLAQLKWLKWTRNCNNLWKQEKLLN